MICDKRFKDEDYQTIVRNHSSYWKPNLPEADYRKSFEVDYLELSSRYEKRRLILPLLLSDAYSLLFSDRDYERKFIVRMWCLLNEYIRKYKTDPSSPLVTRDHDGYPLKFTSLHGPVPIQILRKSNQNRALGRTGSADRSRGTGHRYAWTDDEYRFVILGFRAVGIQPHHHVESNRKCVHAHNHSRKSRTCGELLPSIFLGQETPLQFFCWDKNVFGCTRCDAHTAIFTYIAHAEYEHPKLACGTIKPSLIPGLLNKLDNDRYKYEDLWNLIARSPSQWPRDAGPGNAWGMFKLNRLDWIREHSGEGVHWNQSRYERVMAEIASYKKERKRERSKTEISKDVQESDDDIVEISDPSSSSRSVDKRHTTSTKDKVKKRLIGDQDTDRFRRRHQDCQEVEEERKESELRELWDEE